MPTIKPILLIWAVQPARRLKEPMRIDIEHPTNRPNFSIVRLGTLRIAFSYQTPIGYDDGSGWVVRVNDWGPTTGKHLNQLDSATALDDGYADRIPGDQFEANLTNVLAAYRPVA